MGSFQKSFVDILNELLIDYRNQVGALTTADWLAKYADESGLVPDVSKETLIRLSATASAIWGLYYEIDQASKQIFPDTSDHDNLLHHGSDLGLIPVTGEDDTEFLARLQEDERRPPAGGNQYDYIGWAKSINNVANAFPFPLAQGDGTLDLVVVADQGQTGSELPSNSSRIGNTTSAAANKLNDTGATFTTALAVAVGDIVENPAKRRSTTVTAVNSAIQLTLADDIFKYANESYIVYHHTGTVTTVTPNKLVDAAGAFNNAGRPVVKGDVIENLDMNTQTTVAAVDGAGSLSLVDDIFTAIGQRYVVRSLIAQVKKYIETMRETGASRTACLAPTIQTQDVTMACSGQNVDKAKIALDITSYMSSLEPGQVLYQDQLTSIAIQDGAEHKVLTTPNADVVPGTYVMLRPGVITVT
jgi:uncharacterized phage protein gp47/JayE